VSPGDNKVTFGVSSLKRTNLMGNKRKDLDKLGLKTTGYVNVGGGKYYFNTKADITTFPWPNECKKEVMGKLKMKEYINKL